jgi:hypothetical protein
MNATTAVFPIQREPELLGQTVVPDRRRTSAMNEHDATALGGAVAGLASQPA